MSAANVSLGQKKSTSVEDLGSDRAPSLRTMAGVDAAVRSDLVFSTASSS